MRALIDIRWTAQWSGLVTRDGLRRLFAVPRRGAATALVLATMAGAAAASGAVPSASVAAPAAAPQDPLYREFLEWRASRAKASTNR